jgi:uncharacterized membrane protein
VTPTIHMLAQQAADLVRSGLSPADALETTLAGERLSSSERERIEQRLSELDAYRSIR